MTNLLILIQKTPLKQKNYGLLIFDGVRNDSIINVGMDVTFHERPSIIILDIPFPPFRRHPMFFAEALFFEISCFYLSPFKHL